MIEGEVVTQEAVDCYAEIARQVLKLAELGYLRPRKEPDPFNMYELLKVSLDHKDGMTLDGEQVTGEPDVANALMCSCVSHNKGERIPYDLK